MFERIESLYHTNIVEFLKEFSTSRITDIELKFRSITYSSIENPAGYTIENNNFVAKGVTLRTFESDFQDSNLQILSCRIRYDTTYSNIVNIDCLTRELVVYNDETLVPIEILRKKDMIGRYQTFRNVTYKFT